jgi:hypothetical protein
VRDHDLDRLVETERRWRADLERRKEHWHLYADRLLCVCLAQGGGNPLLPGHSRMIVTSALVVARARSAYRRLGLWNEA